MCWRMVERTLSEQPAPMRLLTSEPHVEAKAIITMNRMPLTLRMMFVTASDRSPRCSM